MQTIDLNCDMGETTGGQLSATDDALLNYISSANIACGFHAGGPDVMQHTVNAAIKKGVAIGAHPGLADYEGFGRYEMAISPAEAYRITLYQIGSLYGFVRAAGGRLHHVKPHGALYNMAARDAALATAIAQAVYDFDASLILYALVGSEMIKTANKLGLRTASEVFADRTYQDNGLLTPRSEPGALIVDEQQSVEHVLRMVKQQEVVSVNGNIVGLKADTVCLHGDGEHAVAFAKVIYERLVSEAILVRTL
jgi:UPF0271 protein